MKVFAITLGCKVNQYETQVMLSQMCRAGFIAASCEEESDVILVNSWPSPRPATTRCVRRCTAPDAPPPPPFWF